MTWIGRAIKSLVSRKTQRQPKVVRIPGADASSSCAIRLFRWPSFRLDPNGYYRVHDLATDVAWSMADIAAATRRRAKALHPDTGYADPDAMKLLLVARRVLLNPRMRLMYDLLPPGEHWPDSLRHESIVRKAKEEALKRGLSMDRAKKIVDAVEDFLASEGEPEMPTTPAQLSGLAWYRFEDEEPSPTREDVEREVCTLALALWSEGLIRPVRVGFTHRPGQVVSVSEGPVRMVTMDKEVVPQDESLRVAAARR
jgi:hypothetical protein